MAALLGRRRPPTAVLAQSDEVALGALRTLRRAGLRVPDDVSVIGVDDQPTAALVDLTTVAQPVREQGRLAGVLVRAVLGDADAVATLGGDAPGPDRPRPALRVPTRLVRRGSTAPPEVAPAVPGAGS
jgi:DNA-binding LacI/PurR family transcriptional regulator